MEESITVTMLNSYVNYVHLPKGYLVTICRVFPSVILLYPAPRDAGVRVCGGEDGFDTAVEGQNKGRGGPQPRNAMESP